MNKRSVEMARLGAMVLEAELAKLNDLNKQRSALATQISALRASVKAVGPVEHDGELNIALTLGANGRYAKWVDQQIRKKNLTMAQLSAEIEDQMKKARTAFGRAQVLEKISKK